MLGVDLIAQLVAAAEPLPGQELTDVGAERHRGEEGERGILAGVIAGRRPAGLDRALGDRIEALEGGNECTRLEELHLELATGHALDVLHEAHTRGAEMRERTTERTLHFPAHLVLGAGRGGHQHERGGRRAHDSRSKQAFRHMAVLPSSPRNTGAGRAGPKGPRGFELPGWRRHKSLGLGLCFFAAACLHGTTDFRRPYGTNVARSSSGVKRLSAKG